MSTEEKDKLVSDCVREMGMRRRGAYDVAVGGEGGEGSAEGGETFGAEVSRAQKDHWKELI